MFLNARTYGRNPNLKNRLKAPESKPFSSSRELSSKQGVTFTWLKDLVKEIVVWSLLYAATFGVFLFIRQLNS